MLSGHRDALPPLSSHHHPLRLLSLSPVALQCHLPPQLHPHLVLNPPAPFPPLVCLSFRSHPFPSRSLLHFPSSLSFILFSQWNLMSPQLPPLKPAYSCCVCKQAQCLPHPLNPVDSPGTGTESEMCPLVLWKTLMVQNGARCGGAPALGFYQGLPGLLPPAPPRAAGLPALLSLAVYHSCEPHKEVVPGQEILAHLGI